MPRVSRELSFMTVEACKQYVTVTYIMQNVPTIWYQSWILYFWLCRDIEVRIESHSLLNQLGWDISPSALTQFIITIPTLLYKIVELVHQSVFITLEIIVFLRNWDLCLVNTVLPECRVFAFSSCDRKKLNSLSRLMERVNNTFHDDVHMNYEGDFSTAAQCILIKQTRYQYLSVGIFRREANISVQIWMSIFGSMIEYSDMGASFVWS